MTQKTNPTPPATQQVAASRISGMNCPVCQNFIPISVHQLLHEGGIMCPHCGLSMTINKSQSKRALDALEKVEEATKRVKDTENFKR